MSTPPNSIPSATPVAVSNYPSPTSVSSIAKMQSIACSARDFNPPAASPFQTPAPIPCPNSPPPPLSQLPPRAHPPSAPPNHFRTPPASILHPKFSTTFEAHTKIRNMSTPNIQTGQQAPDFTLYDSDKQKVTLSDLKGRNVLLLFFPQAFTGTCTKELCNTRDNIALYNEANAQVLAISVDS